VLNVVEDTLALNCVHVCTALRRLAVLQKQHGVAVPFESLTYARLERMLTRDAADRLDARGLAAVSWAAAVLERPALLSAVLSHSAARLRDASLQELALVTWAVGRLQLGTQHAGALSAVADCAATQLVSFDPLQLALRVLHDLSALPPHARHLDAAAPLRRLSAINPQSLTRLLGGFAACQHAPPRRLLDLLGAEAARLLPLFDASSLAFLLAAHAKLGLQPLPRLLNAAPAALASALPQDAGGPLAAALAVWAFARLRVHPGGALLGACDAALAQAAAPGLRSVSTARLVGCVWACGALSTRPVLAWPAMATALAGRELRPADVRTLTVGLARLRRSTGAHVSDAALLQALPPPDAPVGRAIWLRCRPLPLSAPPR
jgi:hypothetical protein